MSSADGGEACARRPMHVDYAPSREVALERSRGFRFDLCPRGIGNGGKLSMQIIHGGCLLSANRCPANQRSRARAERLGPPARRRPLQQEAGRRLRFPKKSRKARKTGFP